MRHEENGDSMREREQNSRDHALVCKVFSKKYSLLGSTLEFACCKLHPRRVQARPKNEGVFPKSMAHVKYTGLRAQQAEGLGDRCFLEEEDTDPYLQQRPEVTSWPRCSLSGPVVALVLLPRPPLVFTRTSTYP